MKQLELYISEEPQGFHTFRIRECGATTDLDFRSADVNEMYREAARIIEGDVTISRQMRVYDPTGEVVRAGNTFVALKTLRQWFPVAA